MKKKKEIEEKNPEQTDWEGDKEEESVCEREYNIQV